MQARKLVNKKVRQHEKKEKRKIKKVSKGLSRGRNYGNETRRAGINERRNNRVRHDIYVQNSYLSTVLMEGCWKGSITPPRTYRGMTSRGASTVRVAGPVAARFPSIKSYQMACKKDEGKWV